MAETPNGFGSTNMILGQTEGARTPNINTQDFNVTSYDAFTPPAMIDQRTQHEQDMMRETNLSSPGFFRVRSQVNTQKSLLKNQRLNRQMQRLSQPKPDYIPRDPFKYSDFRGLLNADYKEALAEVYDQNTLDLINVDEPKKKRPHSGSSNASINTESLNSRP